MSVRSNPWAVCAINAPSKAARNLPCFHFLNDQSPNPKGTEGAGKQSCGAAGTALLWPPPHVSEEMAVPAAAPQMEKQVLPWKTSSKPSQELHCVHQVECRGGGGSTGMVRPPGKTATLQARAGTNSPTLHLGGCQELWECRGQGKSCPPEPGATMARHGAGWDGMGDVPLDAAAWEPVAPGLSPGEVTLLWDAVQMATRITGGGHKLCVATGGHSLQLQGDHKPPGSSFATSSLWEDVVGSEEEG